jgi:hypothetical protein
MPVRADGHYSAGVPDHLDAVLSVLEQAGQPLTAHDIKLALRTSQPDVDVDDSWPRVQKRLRAHAHVIAEPGHRYRWSDQPRRPDISPDQAVARLARGGLSADQRAALATIVQAALSPPGAADNRAATMPLLRALAELAIEVEELTVNGASAEAMIHRVRARARRVGLEPIDAAGEQSTLDRSRHEPIGRPIADDQPVVVVRPGYVWKAPTGDVLIARAVVRDRSQGGTDEG